MKVIHLEVEVARQAMRTLQQVIQNIEAEMERARRDVGRLQSAWKGPAAEEFFYRFQIWWKHRQTVLENLQGLIKAGMGEIDEWVNMAQRLEIEPLGSQARSAEGIVQLRGPRSDPWRDLPQVPVPGAERRTVEGQREPAVQGLSSSGSASSASTTRAVGRAEASGQMSASTPDAGLEDAANRVGKHDSGTSSIGAGATGGAVSGRGTGTSSVGSGITRGGVGGSSARGSGGGTGSAGGAPGQGSALTPDAGLEATGGMAGGRGVGASGIGTGDVGGSEIDAGSIHPQAQGNLGVPVPAEDLETGQASRPASERKEWAVLSGLGAGLLLSGAAYAVYRALRQDQPEEALATDMEATQIFPTELWDEELDDLEALGEDTTLQVSPEATVATPSWEMTGLDFLQQTP